MTTLIDNVSVELRRDPEKPIKMQILVKVSSLSKPNLKAETELDPGNATDAENLTQLVGIAAAAAAEYLNEKHKDNLDEVMASNSGIKAFVEEIKYHHELTKSAPAKIKRLMTRGDLFSPSEIELIKFYKFALDQNKPLLPSDVSKIDILLGRIHRESL